MECYIEQLLKALRVGDSFGGQHAMFYVKGVPCIEPHNSGPEHNQIQ